MSSANNTQVGGSHYKSNFQHWDMVAVNRLGYFEGQVTKYVTRWRKKNGVQDLEKAGHFLAKLIELNALKGPSAGPALDASRARILGQPMDWADYAAANGLNVIEATVVQLVGAWGGHSHYLHEAQNFIRAMIANPAEDGAATGSYVNQDPVQVKTVVTGGELPVEMGEAVHVSVTGERVTQDGKPAGPPVDKDGRPTVSTELWGRFGSQPAYGPEDRSNADPMKDDPLKDWGR